MYQLYYCNNCSAIQLSASVTFMRSYTREVYLEDKGEYEESKESEEENPFSNDDDDSYDCLRCGSRLQTITVDEEVFKEILIARDKGKNSIKVSLSNYDWEDVIDIRRFREILFEAGI